MSIFWNRGQTSFHIRRFMKSTALNTNDSMSPAASVTTKGSVSLSRLTMKGHALWTEGRRDDSADLRMGTDEARRERIRARIIEEGCVRRYDEREMICCVRA